MDDVVSQIMRFPMTMAQAAIDQFQRVTPGRTVTTSSDPGRMLGQSMMNTGMAWEERPPGEETLVEAVRKMSLEVGVSADKIVDALGGSQGQLPVYDQAKLGPDEEVLLCYTVGTLKFTRLNEISRSGGQRKSNVTYGLLDMDLYDVTGKLNGRYLTVWKPEKQPMGRPEELTTYTGPWFENDLSSFRAIPKYEFRANSVAEYSFVDKGGSLYATGPANLLIVPLTSGTRQFHISVATYVTGGSGAFANATGVNTALGSSFIPADIPDFNFLDPPHGLPPIPGVTVSTFRIVRNDKIDRGHSLYSELPVETGVY